MRMPTEGINYKMSAEGDEFNISLRMKMDKSFFATVLAESARRLGVQRTGTPRRLKIDSPLLKSRVAPILEQIIKDAERRSGRKIRLATWHIDEAYIEREGDVYNVDITIKGVGTIG